MTQLAQASARVNTMVNAGIELCVAIRHAAAVFGVEESALWAEWEF